MIAVIKDNLDRLDVISWGLVFTFFVASAVLFKGYLQGAAIGALGIIGLMMVISLSIATILGVMQNHPKIGEIAGFITNGPEALCVIVGLFNQKLLFAASVPLGSNFANPLLLMLAALLTFQFKALFQKKLLKSGVILVGTMVLAAFFFLKSSVSFYWVWGVVAFTASFVFYLMKHEEDIPEEQEHAVSPLFLLPAVALLIIAGYYLDPMVGYTATVSHVPEGVIGFVVLSFLSSWPEFRSCLSLIRLNRFQSAIVNILVSNITNLWLAIAGVLVYLVFLNTG